MRKSNWIAVRKHFCAKFKTKETVISDWDSEDDNYTNEEVEYRKKSLYNQHSWIIVPHFLYVYAMFNRKTIYLDYDNTDLTQALNTV